MLNQPPKGRSRLIGGVIALVVIVVVLGLAVKFLLDSLKSAPTPVPAPVQEAPAVTPPPAEAIPPTPAVAPLEQPVVLAPPVTAQAANEPANMVKIADFWIDRTEVSIGEFRSVFPGYKVPRGFTDDLPVVDVTWEDARRFAEQNGKRLCRESEWLFALGDELGGPARAALGASTTDRPRPVTDERDENSHGLLNMIGNVSEWVDPGTDEAAFVGGYWYWNSAGRPAADLKRVNRLTTRRSSQHYIGFRTCLDADPASN